MFQLEERQRKEAKERETASEEWKTKVKMWISRVTLTKRHCLVEFYINPCLVSVPILYPLKSLENIWFSDVFRGQKLGTFANGLTT